MKNRIGESEGRGLFGQAASDYLKVRPGYPDEFIAALPLTGARVLEVGAGPGTATRQLIEAGAKHVHAIEPDPEMVRLLCATGSDEQLTVQATAFEDANLSPEAHGDSDDLHDSYDSFSYDSFSYDSFSYDLAFCGTAFHWLSPKSRVTRFADCLKSAGVLALAWHVFGQPDQPDPFHEATESIMKDLPGSPSGATFTPFALDQEARVNEVTAGGLFSHQQTLVKKQTLTLSTVDVRALYATYSPVASLEPAARRKLLDDIMGVARDQFHGSVERRITSIMYCFTRSEREKQHTSTVIEVEL